MLVRMRGRETLGDDARDRRRGKCAGVPNGPLIERRGGKLDSPTQGARGRHGGSLFAVVIVLALLVCGVALWALRAGAPRTRAVELAPENRTELTTSEQTASIDRAPDAPLTAAPAETRTVAPITTRADHVPAGAFGHVSVRVKRADGKPVGPWTLAIEDVGAARAATSEARRTLDFAEANAGFDAILGSVSAVSARGDGVASQTAWVRVDSNSPRPEIELVLAPATPIEGQVVDPWGAPVVGIEVWFTPAFQRAGSNSERVPMTVGTVTDVLGTFHSPPLVPGQWNVLAGPRAHPLARQNDVAVASAVVRLDSLRLPQTFALTIAVRDQNGGRVAGARVTGNGTNGGEFDIVTDAAGEAHADGLPAGRFRVFADGAARGRTNRVVEVPSETRVDLDLRAVKRP